MIITTTTIDDFLNWLHQSASYRNNFTDNGARALFEYLEDLSDELEGPLEFDPIAWCCEFSEYTDLKEIQEQYWDIKTLDDLRNNTQVIEFDNGIIIANF